MAVSSAQISRLSAFAFLLLVEAGFGLVAEQAALDHLVEHFGRDKHLALFVFRQRFVKVLDDVGKDVESDEIKSSEGGRLLGRPTAGPVILSTSSIE